jgi:hypothetical protein
MRLTEAQLKHAILHEDASVRDAAMRRFAESFSPDVEVMPLVMQAIERFGPRDAFETYYRIDLLAQTEDSIDWAIRELKRDDVPAGFAYFGTLGRLLSRAEAPLLLPRAEEIFGLAKLQDRYIGGIQEQLEFLSWDADRCWRELEDIANRAITDRETEVDFDRASRIGQALARQGEGYIDRALELLSRSITDYDNDPLSYLETFLTELVGRMRLEAAAPILVRRMKASQARDLIWEDTQDALARIASPATVALVTDDWDQAEVDMKVFASGVLGKIHTDDAVTLGLRFLAMEEEEDLRTWLCLALLEQFAFETIEPICQVIREGSYNEGIADLRRPLTAVTTLLDIATEELKRWKALADRAHQQAVERSRRYERYGTPSSLPPRAPAYEPPPEPYKQMPIISTKKHVGRNEPCPCGSGKKFKNCCIHNF